MPRRLRIDALQTVYHVFSRAPNKFPLFRDDEDRYVFLGYLKRAQNRHPWLCLVYSLMTTHYHFQVKTLDEPLAKTMHYLNTLYAGHVNYRYGRMGPVFQSRFRSIPVQVDSYLLTLSRYIHLNAVAAGMVAKPEDHQWSSYREYLGQTSSGLIHVELVLDTLSENTVRQRQLYREFVEAHIAKKPDFSEDTLWKTRILGNAEFSRRLASHHPAAFTRPENLRHLANSF